MRPVTKYDLRVLRFLKRHPHGVSGATLFRKFHCTPTWLEDLCNYKYISHNYEFPRSPDGFIIGDGKVPDTALYTLELLGTAEIESHQWFDLQYIITQILVPIGIALCTYALTYYLDHLG